ncbi:hypothetical protein [Asanoa iriomotensis]|uniref:Apea-like HEPN domain-containing protein n=1 Tax=Asanoa iriomotensis TaxID=234613 RepID=A0ABQ4CFT5_9ACTN|nr:hypothetical protein [Asanoa iriomotensis]GIF61642.1 hypothetical protein Air01nite_77370 [Asanoa iriomotensis]
MFPSGPSFRFPPRAVDELHDAVGWWTRADDEPWGGVGVMVLPVALAEARDWITGPFDRKRQLSWKSATDDLRRAVDSCGVHLRSELGQDLATVDDQARQLVTILSRPGAVDSAVNGWKSAPPAPAATFERLLARLVEPVVAAAAWRDLVDACQGNGASADNLGARRDLFRSLLSGAGFSPRTIGRALAGVLHDSSASATEVRVLLGDLDRDSISTWPRRDEAAGLDETARLALCERVLTTPPRDAHHTVWLVFGQAHMSRSNLNVGPVTFYIGPMVQAMVGQDGPGKEWVPAELRRADGWLRPEDIPTDDYLVFARVDLGQGRLADPVGDATSLARAIVSIAQFDTGTGNWVPWNGYLHTMDDRVTGSMAFHAPAPQMRIVASHDRTGDVLEDLSASLAPHLSPVPAAMREAIDVLRWWQEAGDQSNLPRVVLDVRVVEWVASLVGGGKWYKFLGQTWKQQWIRGRIRKHLFNTCAEAVRRPNAVEPEHRAKLESIHAKIQIYERSGSYTLRVDEALTALPSLRAIHPFHARIGRQLDTLSARLATPAAVEVWCGELEKDWTSQLNRLQRLRNALAHGGPASEASVETVAVFGRELARAALSVTLTSLVDGRGAVLAHEEIRANADAWRAGVPAAPDIATALFS